MSTPANTRVLPVPGADATTHAEVAAPPSGPVSDVDERVEAGALPEPVTLPERIGNPDREVPVLLGDGRGTARVDSDGTLFDLVWRPLSPAPLIDAWQIEPAVPYHVERAFLPRSNVLATTFSTEEGSVRLLDALVPPAASAGGALELVRSVEGLSGSVPLTCSLQASTRPRFTRRGAHGLWSADGRRAIVLQEHGLLDTDAGFISGAFSIAAGERHTFSLTASDDAPLRIPPPLRAHDRLIATVDYWAGWLSGLRLSGPYAALAERALLTLGLLLDEHGGVLTGDYRGWGVHLDGVTTTLRALETVGDTAAIQRMGHWLLRALRRSIPPVPVWSTSARPGRQQEPSLSHTGDLIDGIHLAVQAGLPLTRNDVQLLVRATERVQREWRFPEVTPTNAFPAGRINTYARVRSWMALDRMVKLHEQRRLVAPVERISAERAALRAEIDLRGFSERAGGFTAWYGDTVSSPELLLTALWGYEAATQLHVQETLRNLIARGTVTGTGAMPEPVGYNLLRDPVDDAPLVPLRWTLLAAWCEAARGATDAARARLDAIASLASDVGVVPDLIDRPNGQAIDAGVDPRTQALVVLAAMRFADPPEVVDEKPLHPRVRRANAPDPSDVRAPRPTPSDESGPLPPPPSELPLQRPTPRRAQAPVALIIDDSVDANEPHDAAVGLPPELFVDETATTVEEGRDGGEDAADEDAGRLVDEQPGTEQGMQTDADTEPAPDGDVAELDQEEEQRASAHEDEVDLDAMGMTADLPHLPPSSELRGYLRRDDRDDE